MALTDRQLQALACVGRGRELAQYQLHEWIFPGRAESIVSRFVGKMAGYGFLTVDRLGNGTGMNRMHLTTKGLEVVVTSGIAAEADLFVPRSFVALKDLAHSFWINDVCLVLATARRFDTVRQSWALQRAHVSAPAVPDVLAIRSPRAGVGGLVLAIEVDLGAERLSATFVPKLRILAGLLATQAGGTKAGIEILTKGTRRAEVLREKLAEAALPVQIGVDLLPSEAARPGLRALRRIFGELL